MRRSRSCSSDVLISPCCSCARRVFSSATRWWICAKASLSVAFRSSSTSQVCRTRVGRVSSKPEIDFPSGPAPAQLVIEDLVIGDGPEAKPGGVVEVHYVGVEYDTGEEFDSSWGRGESIEFPLRGLIQGWQDGIPGMKVGGRRQLVVPPAQAYGPAGSGHQLSGKTLIFVIDLLSTR